MRRSRSHVVLALVAMLAGLLIGAVGAAPASAHEERPATFPDGTGERPAYLGLDNPRHRVVCRPHSDRRIAQMRAGRLKTRNQRLLEECRFGSIQTAINSIKRRNTSIYVLPGYYTEGRWARAERSAYCSNLQTASADPLDVSEYIGSLSSPDTGGDDSGPIALSYPDQVRCPHNLNLIAIFGDRTPRNDSIRCDSRLCGTQLVGTGARRTDVVIDNRHNPPPGAARRTDASTPDPRRNRMDPFWHLRRCLVRRTTERCQQTRPRSNIVAPKTTPDAMRVTVV